MVLESSLMRSLLAAAALLLGLAMTPTLAVAQSPCPAGPGPGEVIVGTITTGSMQVPVCGANGAFDGDDGGGGSGFDAVDYERAQAAEMFAATLREGAEIARRGNEMLAEGRRMQEGGLEEGFVVEAVDAGSWSFAPAAFCGAAFYSAQGLVSITGPGPNQPGVFLTFWSNRIPQPRSPRSVSIRLQQAGGSVQTVSAMNYSDTAMGMGAIIVSVPTTNALLDNMLEDHDFHMWIGSERVVDMAWHDGLAAKARVQSCFASAAR